MPLTPEQYNSIMQQFDRRRRDNRYALEQRTQEIYKKIPQIEIINNSISSLSIDAARKRLSGIPANIDKLQSDISDLANRRKSLLIMNGYPADYLELSYCCNDCMDTGFIDGEKCHCFKQAEIDILYSQSNIATLLNKENFDTFSFEYYSNEVVDPDSGKTPLENIDEIVDTCYSYVRNFGKEHKNLLFLGETGVGKTFLTNCIANELLKKSYSVIYLSAIRLFDLLASYSFHSKNADNDIYTPKELLSCDLLIIDDLGTELTNSFTNSAFFNCLNERLIQEKSTVISTNLSIEELNDVYSERILSRITGNYTLLKIFGDDIRLLKRNKYTYGGNHDARK